MTRPDVHHADSASAFEPTEHYPELRESCPVHLEAEHEPPFYVISRFDDVVEVLKSPDVWVNRFGPGVFHQENGVLGTTDDPDHARHRRVLRSAFVASAVRPLEDQVRQITDTLIDAFVADGSCEFVESFAAPLPALAIGVLLGVEESDRADFGHWSNMAVAALTGGDVEHYHEAKTRLEDYVQAGMDDRSIRLPDGEIDDAAASILIGTALPDDVLSLLTIARHNGTIDNQEARHLGYQLLVAGHETTTSLIGLMLYRLIEQPALMARLRADPSMLPSAVEEALRFDSPVHGLFRTNPDEACLHDTVIPAGSKLQVAFAAANRDPARFDDPDTFRLDRDQHEIGRHVAFGWGVHHCIGAHLARLETRVAFEQLLGRLDDIALDGEPVRNDSFVLHGLTELPITFSSRSATAEEATR